MDEQDRQLWEMARDALGRLCNEANGFLGMADPDQHGRTNMAVLKLRIDNGREAIAALNARLAQEESPAPTLETSQMLRAMYGLPSRSQADEKDGRDN